MFKMETACVVMLWTHVVVIQYNNMTSIPMKSRNRNAMNRVYMVAMYEKLEQVYKWDNIAFGPNKDLSMCYQLYYRRKA